MQALSNITIVELTGHIIDSLTLTKVIDKIQSAGYHYQINDIQIGQRKNDFSVAHLSIWADDISAMDALLAELRTYGALPIANESVQLSPCEHTGVAPSGAYIRQNPPMEILIEGAWKTVERQGVDMVIVLTAQGPVLKPVQSLKPGEQVVMGSAGIKVLPTLSEVVHA